MARLSFGVKTPESRQWAEGVETLCLRYGELRVEFPYGKLEVPFNCGFDLEPADGEKIAIYWGPKDEILEADGREFGRLVTNHPVQLSLDDDGAVVISDGWVYLTLWPSHMGLFIRVRQISDLALTGFESGEEGGHNE